MRHPPEHFGDREMDLVYIGKRLSRAKEAERHLTEAGIDYAVEVDQYVGGVIFRSTRAGAFFYVLPADRDRARDVLRAAGFKLEESAAPPGAPPEPG